MKGRESRKMNEIEPNVKDNEGKNRNEERSTRESDSGNSKKQEKEGKNEMIKIIRG